MLIVFGVATLVQLYYWGFVFSKLAYYNVPTFENVEEKPVSVIICAKNEAENLKKNLPAILEQTYSCFEVLVVDDDSYDKTATIVLEFQKMYPILRLIQRKSEDISQVGKKFALDLGIRNAEYDIVLLTDADCKPNSSLWIRYMQAYLRHNVQIGLGYSPYKVYPSFLNIFIRFETIQTAIQYMSFALWRKPYMGVGRNLIYLKSLFYKANGFKSHEHIASGDDDLFINAISHLDNTTIILDNRTFVLSEPKRSWRALFRQKSRHLSTGTSYKTFHQVLLGLLSGSHFMHYFLGIFTLLQGYWEIAISLYFLRMLLVLLVSRKVIQKLNEPLLLLWIPVLDVIMVIYYVVFTPVLILGAKNRW